MNFFAKVFWKLEAMTRARARWRTARYRLNCLREALGLAFAYPRQDAQFHIVTSERNAGPAMVKCLESVHSQDYPRALARHIVIDDASTDDTPGIIARWLQAHPSHGVEFVHNAARLGGCANNLKGFRMAGTGAIALELNGDDWLPDPGVLRFLNKVYADENVWMTYNTLRFATGALGPCVPVARSVVEGNAFRNQAEWTTSHLHTFRKALFDHVDEECLIDPETGQYWASADDMALYLRMLELAGPHSRHIHRVTYIYNVNEQSELNKDRSGQLDRERRIRNQPKRRPLERL